jgi:hypothetical protein
VDGNFSELLKLPFLKDFWFTEKKHYNLKREEAFNLLKK